MAERHRVAAGPVAERHRVAAGLALLLFIALVASVARGTPAAAAVIGCGHQVTTDIVLDHDLGPCPGVGLNVLSKDGLTIDLNGHKIIGTSVVEGDADNPSTGIRVIFARQLTIKNGTITRFTYGITGQVLNQSLLTGLYVVDNTGAVFPGAGGPTHGGGGLYLDTSHDNVIRGNRFVDNGPIAGIRVVASGGNLIEGNVVQGNDIRQSQSAHALNVRQQDVGILIAGFDFPPRPPMRTGQNRIRNNQVIGNGWHGISVTGFSSDNVVTGNQVVGNGLDQPDSRITPYGDGIHIVAPNNVIESNVVTRNGANGIGVNQPGVQVLRNSSTFNSQRTAVFPTYDLFDARSGCEGNVWSRNVYRTFNQPCVTA